MMRLTPNKVSPFAVYTVHLTNSTKYFSWMMRRVTITVNLISSPANIPPEASTMNKKLLRPCSKLRRSHNTMALSVTLALTATSHVIPFTRRHNKTWICTVSMCQWVFESDSHYVWSLDWSSYKYRIYWEQWSDAYNNTLWYLNVGRCARGLP